MTTWLIALCCRVMPRSWLCTVMINPVTVCNIRCIVIHLRLLTASLPANPLVQLRSGSGGSNHGRRFVHAPRWLQAQEAERAETHVESQEFDAHQPDQPRDLDDAEIAEKIAQMEVSHSDPRASRLDYLQDVNLLRMTCFRRYPFIILLRRQMNRWPAISPYKTRRRSARQLDSQLCRLRKLAGIRCAVMPALSCAVPLQCCASTHGAPALEQWFALKHVAI